MDKVVKSKKDDDLQVSVEGYQKQIVEMVEKIDNPDYLIKIFSFIKVFLEE